MAKQRSDRIIRMPEMMERLDCCDDTLRNMESRGEIPERVRAKNGRAIGWRASDIQDVFDFSDLRDLFD